MTLIEAHCNLDNVVVALIGNKCDNRELQIVKFVDAVALSKEIGASIYLEVSAKENEGMD